MLLAVDVGNTDVTFGVFKEEELITRFRFTVKVPRTSDEYGELLCNILEQKGFSPDDIDEVIIDGGFHRRDEVYLNADYN